MCNAGEERKTDHEAWRGLMMQKEKQQAPGFSAVCVTTTGTECQTAVHSGKELTAIQQVNYSAFMYRSAWQVPLQHSVPVLPATSFSGGLA